jgi:hypothetical protein
MTYRSSALDERTLRLNFILKNYSLYLIYNSKISKFSKIFCNLPSVVPLKVKILKCRSIQLNEPTWRQKAMSFKFEYMKSFGRVSSIAVVTNADPDK